MPTPKVPPEVWMKECLRLARRGLGSVSPNPMVGAVIVKGDRIVACGFHRFFGGHHAEVECLSHFRGDPRGARLYVNLEPCAHHGKTPPCADMIVKSGIRDVVIGMKDPNPLVAGRGIRLLKRAGVRTIVGIGEKESRVLNEWFVKHITTGRPFIHLKLAQTLDGKIAGGVGTSEWISSPASRRLVHEWRVTHDAILVGAETVIADDPRLNVRLVRGRNPHVIIVDGKLRTPPGARALQGLKGRKVFLCTSDFVARRKQGTVRRMRESGVQVISFPADRTRISLTQVVRRLYRYDIGTILVEGGADIASGFLYGGLVDRLSIFVSPRMMGSGLPAFGNAEQKINRPAQPLKNFTAQRSGNDLLLQYDFQ